MDKVIGHLTVLFEYPFWVGIFERIENGKLSVAKVTFDAEPKDYEVAEFVLKYAIKIIRNECKRIIIEDIKEETMIIDGHAHACGSYYDVEHIQKYMKAHKIDKVILCGGEPNSKKNYGYPMFSKIFTSERLGFFFNKIISRVTASHQLSKQIDHQNQLVYEYSTKLPDKVINAYWINPLEEDCIEKMQEFYQKYGFHLIKMHQCWTRFDICSEQCHKIFKWAEEKNLPVFIHLRSKDQVISFVKMVNQYKSVKFVVAHMIGIESMINRLDNSNIYWDLSAPQLYSTKMLKRAISKNGCNHLLLGSDSPYGKNNIEEVLKRLKQLDVSQINIDKITYENAMKLYNI